MANEIIDKGRIQLVWVYTRRKGDPAYPLLKEFNKLASGRHDRGATAIFPKYKRQKSCGLYAITLFIN